MVVCRKVRERCAAAAPEGWPAAGALGLRSATGQGAQSTGKQLVPPAPRYPCAHSPYPLKRTDIGKFN